MKTNDIRGVNGKNEKVEMKRKREIEMERGEKSQVKKM